MAGMNVRALSRRRFVLSIGIGAAGLVAACGGNAPATPEPTRSASIVPASQIVTPTSGAQGVPAAAATTAPVTAAAATSGSPVAGGQKQIDQNREPGAPPPDLVAKPPSGKPQVTLRFHMRSGGEKTEQSIYVFRPTEWEEQTGHKVTLEPIPGDATYVPKLLAQISGGTAGDLTWASDGSNEYRFLARNGALEPLDATLKSFNISKDEWRKSVVDQLSLEGKLYGAPKAGYAAYTWVWVNLKMFKEAGLPEPSTSAAATPEQIRDWAGKLAKGPKDRRDVHGWYSEVAGHQQVTNGGRAFGADIVDKDGASSLVDRPEFLDWVKWNAQMMQDGVAPVPSTIAPNSSQLANNVAALFASQKLAMAQGDRSFHFLVRQAVKDFDFAVIPYPRTSKAIGWGAVCSGHCALASSKFKDEVGSLTYAEGDKRFAFLVGKYNGYLTGRANNLEELGPYANDPFIQIQYRHEGQTAPYWTPKNFRTQEISAALTNALDTVWTGKRPADQAFTTELKKTIDDILARPAP